jgi:hypothetical protein
MRSLWWTGQWHGLRRKDGEVLEQMANSNNWGINKERNLYTGNARVRFPQADNDRYLTCSSSRLLAPVSDGFGRPTQGIPRCSQRSSSGRLARVVTPRVIEGS